MTTPQSLTEERIDGEFHYAEGGGESPYRIRAKHNDEIVSYWGPWVGEDYADVYPLDLITEYIKAADDRTRHFIERERERVNGLAAAMLKIDADRDAPDPQFGVSYAIARDEENIDESRFAVNLSSVLGMGIDGDTFLEALEKAVGPAANLSPDVLGDQKDKGKAALTAPGRDGESASSGPSAADECVVWAVYWCHFSRYAEKFDNLDSAVAYLSNMEDAGNGSTDCIIVGDLTDPAAWKQRIKQDAAWKMQHEYEDRMWKASEARTAADTRPTCPDCKNGSVRVALPEGDPVTVDCETCGGTGKAQA